MIRIEADQLIDGVDDLPRRPGRLTVAGERIADVGGTPLRAAASTPDGPEDLTFSLPGCTLLPGLIDFHSHVGIDTRHGDLGAQAGVPASEYAAAGISRIEEDLRAGVTTVRLCGD